MRTGFHNHKRGGLLTGGHAPRPVASLDDVITFFCHAQTKMEVLEGIRAFVSPYFDSIAVFATAPRDMHMLIGHGPHIWVPKVAGSTINLGASVFRRCMANNRRYQGPIPVGEEETSVFSQFLIDMPDECWIYPGCVSDGVDCILYAQEPKGLRELCIERLEFVWSKAVLAMRLLYLRKQLASKIL